MLSALIIAGIGEVSAANYIASYNDSSCTQEDNEIGLSEHLYAGGEHVGSGSDCDTPGNCVTVWKCPCTVNTSETVDNLGLDGANCSIIKKFFAYGDFCEDLGAGSELGEACNCFDLVLDYDQNGIFSPGTIDERDKVDNTGVTCSGCVPDNKAGFHIYPEAATIILVASGLFAIYGYSRTRRRK